MSDYVPPPGHAIALDIAADAYTPPSGDSIELDVRSDDDVGLYRASSMILLFFG